MAPRLVKKAENREKERTVEKPFEEVKLKTTKPNKKKYSSFSSFLFKLLQRLNAGKKCQHMSISRHAMRIMNNFVHDMVERIALEAGRLAYYSNIRTMSSREILSATKLLMPQELADYANAEGIKAVSKYIKSRR